MSDKKNLTAGGLIEELQKLDPSTPLFVRGYEGGVDYVTEVVPVKVKLFVFTEGYYGEHDIPASYQKVDETELVGGVELYGQHVRKYS